MEVINPYLGKYSGSSVFLNHGKYGPYLKYDNNLYGVPQCFQKPTFKLDDAIKIIKYKQQKQEEEDKIKNSGKEKLALLEHRRCTEPKGTSEDLDEIIAKVKSKKKVLN